MCAFQSTDKCQQDGELSVRYSGWDFFWEYLEVIWSTRRDFLETWNYVHYGLEPLRATILLVYLGQSLKSI